MAGRPLITNDAESLELGKFQLEAGVGFVKEDSCEQVNVPLALTYGILPRVETAIGFGGQFENRDLEDGTTAFEEGLSDLTLGFKWKLLDQDKAFIAQALSGTIKIPTADHDKDFGSGKVDYDLTWIATRQMTEETTVLFNLGYTWLGDRSDENFSDVLHYGTAVTYQLTPTLQPVVEILFETPVEEGKTSVGVNGGIRWQIHDSLMLDAAVGTRLAGDWPEWTATMGLTWVF